MAKQTGISRDTLHRLERGDASISIAALLALLTVLGMESELDRVAADVGTQGKRGVTTPRADSARTTGQRHLRAVTRQDLIAFAQRDWPAIADLKTAAWIKRRQQLGPTDSSRTSDDLRRHVRATRPDWPTDAARAADLASHVALGESLRRVRTI